MFCFLFSNYVKVFKSHTKRAYWSSFSISNIFHFIYPGANPERFLSYLFFKINYSSRESHNLTLSYLVFLFLDFILFNIHEESVFLLFALLIPSHYLSACLSDSCEPCINDQRNVSVHRVLWKHPSHSEYIPLTCFPYSFYLI